MTLLDKKLKYAELRSKGIEPFHAARQIFPDDNLQGFALKISQEWEHEEVVVEKLKEVKETEDPEERLLSKADLCEQIEQDLERCFDYETKIKLLDLYVKIRGFYVKPQEGTGNTTNIQNNIMMVPCSSSDEEWEQNMKAQQAKLIEEC
jgi:hypothetical protein